MSELLIALDFRFWPSDCWHVMSAQRSRWALAVHRLLGVLLGLWALRHWWESGFDGACVGYLVLAVLIGVPYLASRCIVCGILSIIPIHIRVNLSDNGWESWSGSRKAARTWDNTTQASEHRHHFVLAYQGGSVFIPKRTLATVAVLEQFRALVRRHLGAQCHFEA